ncbi:hypothetical protein HK405_002211, partial [Cladochytrium tenue]
FLQLATVRPDGTPSNRTIVFRGFWDPAPTTGPRFDSLLEFVTDARSQKCGDIATTDGGILAEACWYFPATREQFRLSGRLYIVTAPTPAAAADATYSPPPPPRLPPGVPAAHAEVERLRLWRTMSPALRASFAAPPPLSPASTSDVATNTALAALPCLLPTSTPAGTLPQPTPSPPSTAVRDAHNRALAVFALALLDVTAVDYLCLPAAPPPASPPSGTVAAPQPPPVLPAPTPHAGSRTLYTRSPDAGWRFSPV